MVFPRDNHLLSLNNKTGIFTLLYIIKVPDICKTHIIDPQIILTMALTRQNGTATSGSFRFSPATPAIDAASVASNGEFMLAITVNIKDAKGLAVAGEQVKFTVDKYPEWLLMPEVTGATNASGNLTLQIRGRINGTGDNGFVKFKLTDINNPERNGTGTISFTGRKPSGMKRLYFF